jgi:hypothetical protein
LDVLYERLAKEGKGPAATGGIQDILAIAGHAASEKAIGVLNVTQNELGALLLRRQSAPPRLVVDDYYQALAMPSAQGLNDACDKFLRRQEEADKFLTRWLGEWQSGLRQVLTRFGGQKARNLRVTLRGLDFLEVQRLVSLFGAQEKESVLRSIAAMARLGNEAVDEVPLNPSEEAILVALKQMGATSLAAVKAMAPRTRPTQQVLASRALGREADGQFKMMMSGLRKRGLVQNARFQGVGASGYYLTPLGLARCPGFWSGPR